MLQLLTWGLKNNKKNNKYLKEKKKKQKTSKTKKYIILKLKNVNVKNIISYIFGNAFNDYLVKDVISSPKYKQTIQSIRIVVCLYFGL